MPDPAPAPPGAPDLQPIDSPVEARARLRFGLTCREFSVVLTALRIAEEDHRAMARRAWELGHHATVRLFADHVAEIRALRERLIDPSS